MTTFIEFLSKSLPIAVGLLVSTNLNTLISSFQITTINPIIQAVPFVGENLSDLKLTLKKGDKEKQQLPIVINYGIFIISLINFIIVAFIAYLIVIYVVNALHIPGSPIK